MSLATYSTERRLPVPSSQPSGGSLTEEVRTLAMNHPVVLEHDDLLCLYYHLAYDGWSVLGETPNHWAISIPEDRSTERSDASITRARREVTADRHHSTTSWLPRINRPAWTEEQYETWLAGKQRAALAADVGEEIPVPDFEEQVLHCLLAYPETRGDDKALVLRWNLTFGGWQTGGDGRYTVPRDWRWRSTTPESISACRRRWQKKGVCVDPDASAVRGKRAAEIQAAYRQGSSPWEAEL